VEFVFDRDSLISVSNLPRSLQLDVNGGGWSLLRTTYWINSTPIKIVLERPHEINFYTYSSLVPIISDQLGDLRLNYIDTDTIFINVEEKVTEKVGVSLDSANIPLAENHRLVSKIDVSPDSVILSGPKSQMASLKGNVLLQLDQDEIDEDFEGELALGLPEGGLMSSNTEEVSVLFQVSKYVEHVLAVEAEPLNFPENITEGLAEKLVDLKFLIAEQEVEELNISDFGVIADYTQRDEGDSTVIPVLMYFPEGVYNIEVLTKKLPINKN
ncbi:MAG: hypothetical protein JXQ96_21525, partial [Cyclobacteriaceae bacterium]